MDNPVSKSSTSLKRHKIDFSPDEPITNLVAGRNHVAIATKEKKILIVDTTSSKQTECDLYRCIGSRLSYAKIHRLFIDPTGRFTVISLANAADGQPLENILHVKRCQILSRLRGHLINAIAWNHPRTATDSNNENSTGTILIGTTKGLILQTELVHSDESKFFPLSAGPRQYVKEVFDVGTETGAITGLEYHQITSQSQTERNFVVLVSTNNRLYRIVGSVASGLDPAPLQTLFSQNANSFIEVPGRLKHAKLDVYYPNQSSPPIRLAWLTEPGVMTCEISNSLSHCKTAFESDEDVSIIPYNDSREHFEQQILSATPSGMSPPVFGGLAARHNPKPMAIAVTNFHVIVLFEHCIRAICVLNNVTIYEEFFSTKYGHVQGMHKDPIRNLIWVYFERAVYRYKLSSETRDVWRIYLDQKRFDLAKKYSTDDETKYDRVLCEEAQHYFNMKEYERSAKLFAQSKRPLEDVALMFMKIRNATALKTYLTMKLEMFDHTEVTQLTMVLAWLIEIIVSSISVTKTDVDSLYLELEDLFDSRQVVDCIRRTPKLFYEIIRNYYNIDVLVRVAKLIGDYDHVLQYYMDSGEHEKALNIMADVKNDEYFYKHGHILMKRMPKQFVDALISQTTISAQKIIPVLIQENPYYNKCTETIRYLEHCIDALNSDSEVIHNYLFELYARHRDESTLITFLDRHVPQPDTAEQSHRLDLQWCLRLCTELKLTRTCVKLYSLMGLYEEAVQLALEFDVELAKSIAQKPESDEQQKHIWLNIAQSMLTRDCDIEVATKLLKESRLLNIEDILPFFPDYTTIDSFKDAIRVALEKYRDEINDLKDGTYDNIAALIRTEIKAFRSRYSMIKTSQRCEICTQYLMMRPFYVFPCGHLFHSDCMTSEVISIDPEYNLDQIQSECVYCGNLLAECINKPAPANLGDGIC